MEQQNFETSFIPKKPVVEIEKKVKRPIGILTLFSVLAFATAVITFVGLTFYKNNLAKTIKEKEEDIRIAQNRFEPERIQALETLGRRLFAARDILSEHIAVTPIFEELSKITRKEVSYTDFSYSFDKEKEAGVKVSLKGIARGYRQVALQADLFGENKNLKEPIFSSLSLDERGNVTFNLEFIVDPAFVDYHRVIETRSEAFEIPAPSSRSETGSPLESSNIIPN